MYIFFYVKNMSWFDSAYVSDDFEISDDENTLCDGNYENILSD